MNDEQKPWKCECCSTITLRKDLLVAPNPFLPHDIILGCPVCKTVDDFTAVCDEPGCTQEGTCGFPTADGYRRTCSEHSEWGRARVAAALAAREAAK